MAEGGSPGPAVSQGPPDLIPDIIPVDLVNSIGRARVETLEHTHNGRHVVMQAVDIVDSLPTHPPLDESPVEAVATVAASLSNGSDVADDHTDARWWSRGTGGADRRPDGIPMPADKDAEIYNMNHRRRGKAFIFNHMNFDPKLQLRSRSGTHNDRDNLRVVLRQLDFEVEVYNDLPYKEIERILEQASMEDHSDADCIFVTVLSHGELGILYASDHPYKPENLWGHFTADKCPSLAGKPKMFFIQACQGDRLDSGVRMVARERTQPDAGNVAYKIPSHADFLIAYSTIPGFYSWRNTTQGSWFIQAFCHVAQREGNSRDLLSLLTRVCRKVAFDFQSNVPGDYVMHDKKQIPCITSMLTRDVIFNRK